MIMISFVGGVFDGSSHELNDAYYQPGNLYPMVCEEFNQHIYRFADGNMANFVYTEFIAQRYDIPPDDAVETIRAGGDEVGQPSIIAGPGQHEVSIRWEEAVPKCWREAYSKQREESFRRGYSHGVLASLHAIEHYGAPPEVVHQWHRNKVQRWRYNLSSIVEGKFAVYKAPEFPGTVREPVKDPIDGLEGF